MKKLIFVRLNTLADGQAPRTASLNSPLTPLFPPFFALFLPFWQFHPHCSP